MIAVYCGSICGALPGRESFFAFHPWFLAPAGLRHQGLFSVTPLRGRRAAAPLSSCIRGRHDDSKTPL